jgi:hypothetical protein
LTDAPQSAGLVALADRIELWPIEKLRPYEHNPRTHSDAQVDQIAASMVEFGWTNPLLIDENAGILAGHGRLLAARKLGLAEVPVIRFEHLSEAQKRAYLIADNQLALQAGWSEELLAQELAWLRDESFDLDLIGFDATDLERLLALAEGETTSDDAEDEVPEPPEDPVGAGAIRRGRRVRMVERDAQLDLPCSADHDVGASGCRRARQPERAAGNAKPDEFVGGPAPQQRARWHPDRAGSKTDRRAGHGDAVDRHARQQRALAKEVLGEDRGEARQQESVDPELLADLVHERTARDGWTHAACPGTRRIDRARRRRADRYQLPKARGKRASPRAGREIAMCPREQEVERLSRVGRFAYVAQCAGKVRIGGAFARSKLAERHSFESCHCSPHHPLVCLAQRSYKASPLPIVQHNVPRVSQPLV